MKIPDYSPGACFLDVEKPSTASASEAAVAPVRERERRTLVPAEAVATSVWGGPQCDADSSKIQCRLSDTEWVSLIYNEL